MAYPCCDAAVSHRPYSEPYRLDTVNRTENLPPPRTLCTQHPMTTTVSLTREEELHWIALRMVPGLGLRKSGALIQAFKTPQAVFRASRAELEGAGLSGSVAQTI